MTNATERQARSRKARADAGGKSIHLVLTPAAAAKLAQWRALGHGTGSTVCRLLEQSKPVSV